MDEIIKDIETEYQEFKTRHQPLLDNTYIMMEVLPEMINFGIMNSSNLCIAGSIQSTNINIDNITHCGGNNISLLLEFIRTISIGYDTPIMLNDVSAFIFENVDNNEDTFIELKKLYELSEGRTYYDKYLNPDKEPIGWPTTPISSKENGGITLFESGSFTPSEKKRITEILNEDGIYTIGEFFMKIRELLKSISYNGIGKYGDGVKLVESNNWNNLKIYKGIIDKTYDMFAHYKKGGKSKRNPRKFKKKSRWNRYRS